MQNQNNDYEENRALQIAKEVTGNDAIVAGLQVILSAIPYAGGPLSNILSEFRYRRAFDKVYNTMNELKEAVESQGTEISKILKPDEVIELVQKTLREIVDTASEIKTEYLNNALVNAFTTGSIEYSQKQHYLEVLKSLTAGEVELLKELYMHGDPFDHSYNLGAGILGATDGLTVSTIGSPQYEEPDSGDTLLEALQRRMSHLSSRALEGVIKSLDSKGLSNIAPNLGSRMIIKKRTPYLGNVATIVSLGPNRTPYEASRTEFGQDFVTYITSKYYGR